MGPSIEASGQTEELLRLKLKLKKWEKLFFTKEHRKPEKQDVEANEQIRSIYNRYWFLVKRGSGLKENNVWRKELNKQPLVHQRMRSTSKANSNLIYTNKYADKLMKHFVEGNIESKNSFSLKRKPKPLPETVDEESTISIHDIIKNTFDLEETTNLELQSELKENINKIVDDSRMWSDEESNDSGSSEAFDLLPEIQQNVCNVAESSSQMQFQFNSQQSTANEVSMSEKVNKPPTNDANETAKTMLLSMISPNPEEAMDKCVFDSSGISTKHDVYEFVDEEPSVGDSTDSEVILAQVNEQKKKKSTSLVKENVKRRKAAPKSNFLKLNMRRKGYASKGYRKFNTKKYKYTKWKNNKNRNRCFKCGESDHWAQDCPLKDVIEEMRKHDLDENFDWRRDDDYIPQIVDVKPLLRNDEDGEELLNNALVELGFEAFRKNQLFTVKRIVSGKSTVLISPTGSGKSLCYQLPAYLFWKQQKCITVIVSPLISLMEDQLACLPKRLKGVALHSGLKPNEKRDKLAQIQAGNVHVVFLSPEMIVGSNVINLSSLPSIAFVCIDEAHCLSEWSYNFRPSYLQLYKVLKEKLQIRIFLALTATATKATAKQITKNLGLSLHDIVGETSVPQNLVLSVSRDVDKDFALIELLKSNRFASKKSIIIYCTRREITERIATLLRIEMRNVNSDSSASDQAMAYHAGLTSEERSRIQKKFLRGNLRIVVATIAFGMGINNSNVEAVIHYNLPKSFESYVQEVGRAGRNGSKADCHLFLNPNSSDLIELRRHIYANSVDRRSLMKLLNKVFRKCKCQQLMNFDGVATTSNRRSCPGHEVAFPIKETVLDVDMTEETILTVLYFLQLNYSAFNIEMLPYVNGSCKVLCYKEGGTQMDAVAKLCLPLSLGLTLYKKKNKISETPSMFSFSFVEVASMLGQSSDVIRKQLKSLEWKIGANDRMQRTNVRVEFSELSFHLKAPGDLNDTEFEEVLEFLYKYTTTLEAKEITKLKSVYSIFNQFSDSKFSKKVNLSKSDALKTSLNKYFSNEDFNYDNLLTADALESYSKIDSMLAVDVTDIEAVRNEIRCFISTHGDHQLTGRAIARIFLGIGSPRFPSETWRLVKRFWRCHINIDFNTLMKIANEELISIKTNF